MSHSSLLKTDYIYIYIYRAHTHVTTSSDNKIQSVCLMCSFGRSDSVDVYAFTKLFIVVSCKLFCIFILGSMQFMVILLIVSVLFRFNMSAETKPVEERWTITSAKCNQHMLCAYTCTLYILLGNGFQGLETAFRKHTAICTLHPWTSSTINKQWFT